jgi:hypothetical protein
MAKNLMVSPMQNKVREMSKAFTNREIVTLAIYLLGGDVSHVDIEDVAMKSSELSPGRFTWRKYPDQINIYSIASSLTDARKVKNGNYVMGSMQNGWMLTDKGLKFAQEHVQELDTADLSRKPQTAKERQWQRGEHTRMVCEEAFGKYQAGRLREVTQSEAESFFRVNDYVVGQAREKKVIRLLNAFGDDPELGAAVQALVSLVRGK